MPTQTHSGFQRIIYSFRERVVSDDFNRALQFLARQEAELLRRLHATNASEDEAEGVTAPADAVANPTRAIVFEGIRARPEKASTTLFVEPGVGLFVAPHADPHPADSPARLILDPGVQVAGTLVLTAGGGGTRIDVVECQVSDTVTEADNRDIFDPSTGLFTPALVSKVARGVLAYRIRLGTPGAGFPGTASGWLPLAVCSVPSTAVTWDDVTLWDVRPLYADLAHPPHLVTAGWNGIRRQFASAIDQGVGQWHARGIVDTELFGWKVGGNLAPTESGAVSIRLDAAAVPNVQEPGFAAVASSPWYLYLAQPFNLPRWAQYTPASDPGLRRPRSPRGIPIFTQKAPAGLAGRPSAALSLPTATGLGGTTGAAVVSLAGAFGAGALFASMAVSDWSHFQEGGISVAPVAGAGTLTVTYRLIDNTTHPANAKAVRIRLLTGYADTAGFTTSFARRVIVLDGVGGNTLYTVRRTTTETLPASGAFVDTFELDLEFPPNLPTGGTRTIEFAFTITSTNGGALVFSSQSMNVLGWKLF